MCKKNSMLGSTASDVGADMGFQKPYRIYDREDEYRQRRLNKVISPERHNAFADGEKTPDPITYADIMRGGGGGGGKRRNKWDMSQDNEGAAKKGRHDIMREETLKREKEETLKLIRVS
ncbi:hypothetical protein Lal_00025217 [Lupinus albus]|nr:hypothetical protein Lal_00025217 [Lupinus albus]